MFFRYGLFLVMFFAFFIILLALTNTAMGLYLAVMLGYGPPTIKDALILLGLYQWRRYLQRFHLGELSHYLEPLSRLTGGSVVLLQRLREIAERFIPHKKEKEEEASVDNEIPAESLDDKLKSVSDVDLSDLLDDESATIEMVAPQQELFDDDLVAALMAKGTEAWFMGEKHVETSILKLNHVMMKSGIFSAELDRRLRTARGSVDVTLAKTSMEELRDDCACYLTAQAEMTEQMKKRIDEFGELAHLAENIEYSNMEQAAQIETTINNIDRLNPENSEETATELLKELSKLRLARHRLRDQQEKAFLTVVRYENRMDMIVPQLFVDDTNGLRCRIGLEVTLLEWWKQKRQETRQICFALLDLVKFGDINDEQGIFIGNNAITYIGHLLEKNFSSQDLTGVYYGNCFFIVTVNMGLRKTVAEIEKIRQSLERTNFTAQGSQKPFSIRVTTVITEALPKHTDQEVMEMVEKLIVQAKKAGRGQTFLLDQGKLNPELEQVTSPNFSADYITVDLAADS